MSLIKLDKVSKYYHNDNNVSSGIKDISVSFDLNEFVVITGKSGSGKTTLLNVISGLDDYQEGTMYFNGVETNCFTPLNYEKYRSKHIGFVFQNYNIIDSYTVLQNVLLALEISNYPKEDRLTRARQLINQVGLSDCINQKSSKLSGGQKQRAVLARALAKDCAVIICDEPTGNLDSKSASEIVKLLKEISKDKLVIVVTHDEAVFSSYATRRILMHDGMILEDKSLVATEKINYQTKETKNISLFTLLRFAIRNIFAMPKRLMFFLALFVITIMAFLLVYTNNVLEVRSGIDDELSFSQRIIPNTTYSYIANNRILITRKDFRSFSEADKDYLKNSLTGYEAACYLNNYFIDNDSIIKGLDKNGNDLRLSKFDTDELLNGNLLIGNKTIMPAAGANYQVIVSNGFNLKINDTISISYYNDSGTRSQISFTVSGIYNDNRSMTIYFSSFFLRAKDHEVSSVATISFKNVIEATNYLYSVNRNNYRVIFPGNPEAKFSLIQPINAILTVLLFIVTIIVAMFLYLVIHAVVKNVMKARKKDFAIMRSLGVGEANLALVVILEQVIILLLALFTTSILIGILGQYIYTFYRLFETIKIFDILIIFTTLLVLTILLALRFNKKIFNLSVIATLGASKEELV